MNLLTILLLAALAGVGGLSLLLWGGKPAEKEEVPSLSMYCAAGMRLPVEEIAARYEQEYGVRINLHFEGSNTLLNQLLVNRFNAPDLFLAADDFYTEQAVAENLAAKIMEIAYQRPVIAVPRGNPQGITSVADLLRSDVRVVLANPEQAAIGRATRSALMLVNLSEGNLWEQLHQHVLDHGGGYKPTVNYVATDVVLGSADAGIVWDSTVAMPDYADDLQAIEVPEFDDQPNLISIVVLRSSAHPTEALRFARYLTARDKGLRVFAKFGTRPVEGDLWQERPQVTFFSGAVEASGLHERLDKGVSPQQ